MIFSIKRHAGISLVEVLVAVVVFAIGLLAIAALQGKLVRGGADAKARTVAANLAEQQMEQFRSFTNGTDYGNIVSLAEASAIAETVSGVNYKLWWDVDNYYFPDAGGAAIFGTNPSTGSSNFKMIRIHVDWSDGNSAAQESPIILEDIIPNAPPSDSLLAVRGAQASQPPRVLFDASLPTEPNIIRVHLDGDTVKQTSQPKAEVEGDAPNIVTRFNAVTLTSLDPDTPPSADRREEFLSINCRCTQGVGTGPALTPATWNGDQWNPGTIVDKRFGIPFTGTNNNFDQPFICDRCCRDHHDVDGLLSYDPFRSDAPVAGGDHGHFIVDSSGNLVTADEAGDEYLEACTMVRVGGVYQTAVDFNLENLLLLPIEYLETSQGVANYQAYVEQFVNDYVNQLTDAYPQQRPAVSIADPADLGTISLSSVPPPATGVEGQQLLARAIYINYMGDHVRNRIKCRLGSLDPDVSPDCDGGDPSVAGDGSDADGNSVLPLVPFEEINVTKLATWSEDAAGAGSIFVTRDPLTANNQDVYDRGRAIHCADYTPSNCNGPNCTVTARCGNNTAQVTAKIFRSNTGLLANANKIDPDDGVTTQDSIGIDFDLSQPPPTRTVLGAFAIAPQVHGVELSNISVVGDGNIFCTRPEPGNYKCLFENGADSGTVTVGNYNSVNRLGEVNDYVACPTGSISIPLPSLVTGLPPANNGTANETTTYQFTAMPNSEFQLNIQIKKNGC